MNRINEAASLDTIHEMLGSGKWTMDFDEAGVKGAVDDHYIGDDLKLRQVLINILGNAVKFTPAGGRVTLIDCDRKNTVEKEKDLRPQQPCDGQCAPEQTRGTGCFICNVGRAFEALIRKTFSAVPAELFAVAYYTYYT